MPTYAYRCTECGHAFDIYQAFSDDPLTECPECGGRVRKVLSPVGVVFKGSGFYRTDSRKEQGSSSSKSTTAGSSSGESSGASKDSGSASSGESGGSKGAETSKGTSTSTSGTSSKPAATPAASS